ncbi:MAG: sigma-70 family RNA polymerase sigma factor [Burkholderiaceae bacterium]
MHAQFYDELLRYLTREVKDSDEAQDLVQETYGRVLARVATGERIEDLRGLLYEIARNLLIDRHRRMRVRKHVSDEALAGMHAPASEEPETRYAGQQRVRLLERTIENLPLRCRQAFVLHKLDGLPQAEVAARMGVSLNMVERHIMLAIAVCRKALGDERPRRRTSTASPPESPAERTAK